MDELLTPEDVSKKLKVPIKTLYRWRAEGIGPRAAKFGRHLRYRASDVQRFADERFAAAGPDQPAA